MIKNILYIFLISMVPVVELRGAIPIGVGLGLPFYVVFIAALIGNMVPVPLLILFTRPVFAWLRKKNRFCRAIVEKLEKRAASKEDLLKRYELLGLCILVAIPLPGTGGWTGAMVASFFDIRMRTAVPVIGLGILIAGIIVSVITYGVKIFII